MKSSSSGWNRDKRIDPIFYRDSMRLARYIRKMCRISKAYRVRYAFSSRSSIRALCVAERENV